MRKKNPKSAIKQMRDTGRSTRHFATYRDILFDELRSLNPDSREYRDLFGEFLTELHRSVKFTYALSEEEAAAMGQGDAPKEPKERVYAEVIKERGHDYSQEEKFHVLINSRLAMCKGEVGQIISPETRKQRMHEKLHRIEKVTGKKMTDAEIALTKLDIDILIAATVCLREQISCGVRTITTKPNEKKFHYGEGDVEHLRQIVEDLELIKDALSN